MKKVRIQQYNEFECVKLNTSEEDHLGLVKDRWELFQMYEDNTIGACRKSMGRLVEYHDGNFAVFHGMIRYDMEKRHVTFTN